MLADWSQRNSKFGIMINARLPIVIREGRGDATMLTPTPKGTIFFFKKKLLSSGIDGYQLFNLMNFLLGKNLTKAIPHICKLDDRKGFLCEHME